MGPLLAHHHPDQPVIGRMLKCSLLIDQRVSPVALGEDVPDDPAVLGHSLHGAGPHRLGDGGQRNETLTCPPAYIVLHLSLVSC